LQVCDLVSNRNDKAAYQLRQSVRNGGLTGDTHGAGVSAGLARHRPDNLFMMLPDRYKAANRDGMIHPACNQGLSFWDGSKVAIRAAELGRCQVEMRVLICGGGVIGASTAYFLSLRGVKATVIERTGLACAASGKSGGFLAFDWCDGSPLAPLARHSFALHARLAGEIDRDWGYRRLPTFGGSAGRRSRNRKGNSFGIGWLAPEVTVDQRLGSPETTAQVHPDKFTRAMMQLAQERGADLRLGSVTGIRLSGNGARVEGVEIDGETMAGDAVVIAMGPWSILAADWLPMPAVYGLKGHSLVFATGTAVLGEALFLEYHEGTGQVLTPELFPRPDGTTYVCAISSESPLPVDPTAVSPDRDAIERLEHMCNALSPVLAEAQIVVRQACYRPVARDGMPLIGSIPGIGGAYVATGHSVWGILNAPATGEAMAELITEGRARSLDLAAFDPARLPPFDPSRLAPLNKALSGPIKRAKCR
jgi:glycine/D-amino acid oxidase-like deaminating enzyme